jgi:hypothetical protein
MDRLPSASSDPTSPVRIQPSTNVSAVFYEFDFSAFNSSKIANHWSKHAKRPIACFAGDCRNPSNLFIGGGFIDD